jgi:hypothetical protein
MKLFICIVLSLFLVSIESQAQSNLTDAVTIEISPEGLEQRQYLRSTHNFGIVQVNSLNRAQFYIQNTGSVFLNYNYSNIWGFEFSSSHSCYMGLNPGQTCFVEVIYWPHSSGFHNGNFAIEFSPSGLPHASSHLDISLYGNAIY